MKGKKRYSTYLVVLGVVQNHDLLRDVGLQRLIRPTAPSEKEHAR